MSTTSTKSGPNPAQELGAEAKRLIQFKKDNIKKKDMSPCPECATLVNIQANKCPHCASDISEHTERIRVELKKLESVTAELRDIYKGEMELNRQEASDKSSWLRIKDFWTEPKLLQDLKLVFPFMIGFFVLVLFLRENANGMVFWLVSLGGGFVVYSLFKKWNLFKSISIDLYQAILVVGLVLILGGSSIDSNRFWPEFSFIKESVTVQNPIANIRQAPNTGSSIVATAQKGDKLTRLEINGSWIKVRTEDGVTGWIHSNLVSNP